MVSPSKEWEVMGMLMDMKIDEHWDIWLFFIVCLVLEKRMRKHQSD